MAILFGMKEGMYGYLWTMTTTRRHLGLHQIFPRNSMLGLFEKLMLPR
jgi:hypothetical protein